MCCVFRLQEIAGKGKTKVPPPPFHTKILSILFILSDNSTGYVVEDF